MPFCPKCGKEVDPQADYCYYCGQPLPRAKPIPVVPSKSTEPTIEKVVGNAPKTAKTRNFAIIAIILVAVVAIAVYSGITFLNKQTPFFPTQFQTCTIQGSPSNGVYTATFSLVNGKGINGAANGTVLFKITDLRNNILYETSFTVNSAAFTKNSNNDLIYSWSFPASDVKAGIPISNDGLANFTFSTTNGSLFSSGNYAVEIPTLPNDLIGPVSFSSDSPIPWARVGPSFLPIIYVNDSFILSFQLGTIATGSSETITNIAVTTPGFTVLSITPQTPFTIGTNMTDVTLNISTPSQPYSGSLELFIYTQTPQQGSMAAMSYQITQNSPDYVSVTMENTGLKNLLIEKGYIDGTQCSLEGPMSLNVNHTITFRVYAASGQTLTDSVAHQIEIVASDGTTVAFSIVY